LDLVCYNLNIQAGLLLVGSLQHSHGVSSETLSSHNEYLTRRKVMSKLLFRVAVAVLTGLVIVAGVFATVEAASTNSGQLNGRIDATAGDPFYASQQRGASLEVLPYNMEGNQGGHGGCESEGFNSDDY
jgi:hypothetical protein